MDPSKNGVAGGKARLGTYWPPRSVMTQIDEATARLFAELVQATRAHLTSWHAVALETANGHRQRRLKSLREALEWQIQTESGQTKSRAQIAGREGLSRAAVTQKLHRLDKLDASCEPRPLVRPRRRTMIASPSIAGTAATGYRY